MPTTMRTCDQSRTATTHLCRKAPFANTGLLDAVATRLGRPETRLKTMHTAQRRIHPSKPSRPIQRGFLVRRVAMIEEAVHEQRAPAWSARAVDGDDSEWYRAFTTASENQDHEIGTIARRQFP